MKKAKFSDAQIMAILRQAENGVPISELCREHGMSSASFYKWRAKYGGMDASMMDELRETVLQGADPADPRISPLFADWTNPPPVLIQASDTEILYDDGRRMVERLQQAGSDATFETWPNCPHVWHIFDGWIPEAREALQRTADFANRCLTPQTRQSES